jgi:hypothetical protein
MEVDACITIHCQQSRSIVMAPKVSARYQKMVELLAESDFHRSKLRLLIQLLHSRLFLLRDLPNPIAEKSFGQWGLDLLWLDLRRAVQKTLDQTLIHPNRLNIHACHLRLK